MTKKIAAAVTGVICLALIISGTVSWYLSQDITKLNKFTWSAEAEPDIKVSLEEDFEPWVKKRVFVKNDKDSTDPVIVRVRFEEFAKVSGGTLSINNSGIFTADTLDNYKSDSTVVPEAVNVQFSDHVITMDRWLDSGMQLMDSNKKALWVIDTDGWVYYTGAIKAGSQSEMLLANVAKKSSDENFLNETYNGNNVAMEYYMNVRLQAISADLNSYALSEDNPGYVRDWNNKQGAEITASADGYNIMLNSQCTVNADKLIRAVSAAVQ